MTHPHDTDTPSVSVESEYVLVPREFLHFVRHAPVGSGTCCCGDEMERHSDPMSCGHSPVDMWDHALDQWLKLIAAAPAPNPSPAAKIVEAARDIANRHAMKAGYKRDGEHSNMIVQAINEALSTPSPQPADAVREALETAARALETAAGRFNMMSGVGLVNGADPKVGYSETYKAACRARAALSTPTEGPASQTEGMGGETVAVPYDDFHAAYQFVPRSKMSPDHCLKTRLRSLLREEDLAHVDEAEAIAALTPPETAEALPVGYQLHLGNLGWGRTLYQEDETNSFLANPNVKVSSARPVYAHPDPEAARLREDLERVTRENSSLREERHLADNALVDRYRDPKTGSFQFPTDVATIVRRLDATERERDDAVKALETAREDLAHSEILRKAAVSACERLRMAASPEGPIWGRWFKYEEAPAGSYSCLCKKGDGAMSIAWMPAQGRPRLSDTFIMPFDLPARSASSQGGE